MPRLLLVDDNPSIHRIAESLLAPTDVELVCVDSAAEALDRIARGERFDVALVDTAMPGMDGWTLLGRLRDMEETARMPIALMAGVLDPVDPAKLAKAPVQGFLKKPIELRELGDRVKALLVTPVAVSPSPFSTVPATPARDLVRQAEEAFPEFRPEPSEAPAGLLDAELELPEADLNLPEPEDDLLVLTAEDLWPEEPAPAASEPAPSLPAAPDVRLELEELDLDSLQDLAEEPLALAEPEPAALPEAAREPAHEPAPVIAPLPESADLVDEEDLVTVPSLEELDAQPSDFQLPPRSTESAAVAELDDFLAHLPDAGSLIGAADVAAATGLVAHEAAPEPVPVLHEPATPVLEPAPVLEQVPVPESAQPAAGGQAPAVPGQVVPVSSDQAQALIQALLADPVLVDALVKAVVARMGDQVIREIAWEVMPDLAGKLQR